MSNVTINALPTASTIDGANDILPIYTASATATQGINRNTLLNLASGPVGLTDTQTLTNKTLTSPSISGPILSGTLTGTYTIGGTPTFPSSVVTLTGTQTLTNKTLTSPTINSPTITNATISADTITGFTVSNTGTIYGISVTTGTIGSAALANNSVATAAIQANAVTAAKMVNGIVLQRQGGTTGAGSWLTSGTSNTNTSTTNCFIQAGSLTSSASATTVVTFPTAYNQIPLVVGSVVDPSTVSFFQAEQVTTTTFKLSAFGSGGSRVAVDVMWISIGQ